MMLKTELNQSFLLGVQQQYQVPDHIKCGEVYTWLCGGELYAVECKLCEDQPLCPLSEFPQHMEVWHTDWEARTVQNKKQENRVNINHYADGHDDDDDLSLLFTKNERGLVGDLHNQLHSERITTNHEDLQNNEEILEPFEQVLIEQDATQTSEVVNEDVYFKDANDQAVAEAAQCEIEENKQFFKTSRTLNEQLPAANSLVANERELQSLTEFRESDGGISVKKNGVKGQRNENKKFKRNLTKMKEINENMRETSGNETKVQRNKQNLCKVEKGTPGLRENQANESKTEKGKMTFEEQLKENKIFSKNTAKIVAEIENSLQITDNTLNEMAHNGKYNLRGNAKNFSTVRENGIIKIGNKKVSENIEIKIKAKKNPQATNGYETDGVKNIKTIKKTKSFFKRNQKNSTKLEKCRKSMRIISGKLQNLTKLAANKMGKSENENKSKSKTVLEQNENENCGKGNKTLKKSLKNNTKCHGNETKQSEHMTEQNEIATVLNDSKIKLGKKATKNSRNKTKTRENENLQHEELSKNEIMRKSNIGNKEELCVREKGITRVTKSEMLAEQCGNETFKHDNVKEKLGKSVRHSRKVNKMFENPYNANENERFYCENFKQIQLRKTNRVELDKNIIAANKLKLKDAESSKIETRDNLKQQSLKSKAIKGNLKRHINDEPLKERNTHKFLRIKPKSLRSQSKKGIVKKIETNTLKRMSYLTSTSERSLRSKKRKGIQNVKEMSFYSAAKETKGILFRESTDRTGQHSCREFSEDSECRQATNLTDPFSHAQGAINNSVCVITNKKTFISNSLEDASTKFSESSDCLQGLTFAERLRLPSLEEEERIETLLDVPLKKSPMATSDNNSDTKVLSTDIRQAREYHHKGDDTDSTKNEEKKYNGKNTKQNCVTQDIFDTQKYKKSEAANSYEHNLNDPSSNSPPTNHQNLEDSSTPITVATPFCSLSPTTEEEHFEFFEPKEKLNKQHISHLIKLYHEQTRLWDQSHPDFCEPQICRKSWQQITEQWNEFCKRQFTIAEVRIRICTLCQRFVQERERLALEGEVDECVKFPYYEQMQFLENQKSLQKRRDLYEQQNKKILEIYQHFPVLWHVRYYKLRQAQQRAEAFESISKSLKLRGLHLSSVGVQKRIRSLRKCYRLEKIRHLHAQVEQTSFESEFRHYERMQFLDKHMDPFVCHICGKIFENLHGFRAHLEAENHGNILDGESDVEDEFDKETTASPATGEVANTNENESELFVLSPVNSHIEWFSESENSKDILQRFTPFSCSPNHSADPVTNLQINALENASSYVEGVSNFPLNTPRNETVTDSLHLENQLIEEILETATSHEGLSQSELDQFINSVTSYNENNCIANKAFSPHMFHSENSFVIEHPDIVADQTPSALSPQSNVEILDANLLYAAHPDIVTGENLRALSPASNMETSVPDIFHRENLTVVEETNKAAENALEVLTTPEAIQTAEAIEELKNHHVAQNHTKELPSSTQLMVKVQCADFAVELELNSETPKSPSSATRNTNLNELYSSADISTIPLPDDLIHKMIEFYRKFPQLWNPNHLDYNSRTLKRQAWCSLTTEFNTAVGKQLSWRTLHRKLTDYAKYYKKLRTEQQDGNNVHNKQWTFYQDFMFMDDVIAVHDELQRSVHHRDNNFKIIAIYKTLPQLWNIKHPDYNKRGTKQRNIELMCNRLQEENNMQLTIERLKNRLIELRTQYRAAKKQRLKCLKYQQKFSSSEFEFYEALNFLDDHIDPFICVTCKMEFKKLTDYNLHLRREHSQKARPKRSLTTSLTGAENICHICGTKFSTRSNLLHHVRRHEGIRNYECNMCPKKFYASHALKVHIRSHTKECPYTCEKCGISFVSASKLNQHVKRHLNRKDFPCDFCPKAFFTAFEKDRHERRHLNIRDKACPICGKTFVAGSSYYAHLMLHSDKKRFECDKCDMKFAQYAGLYKHRKRHHTFDH